MHLYIISAWWDCRIEFHGMACRTRKGRQSSWLTILFFDRHNHVVFSFTTMNPPHGCCCCPQPNTHLNSWDAHCRCFVGLCRVSFLVLARVSKKLQKHSLTCSSLSTHSLFKFVLPLLSLLSIVLLDCWLAPVEILLLHSLLVSTFATCSHGWMLLYAPLVLLGARWSQLISDNL